MTYSPKPTDQPDTLQLVEERPRVDKHRRRRKVQVRTVSDVLRETMRASLQSVDVEIERVQIDREVSSAPDIRTEGDLTIVPVLEEILVVEKRLVLREEIRIRRITRTEDVETPVTRRRQRAVVTGTEADTPKTKVEEHL